MLDSVSKTVQRAYAGVAAPREDELPGAAHPDHLVVDEVWGHPDQGEVPPLLPDHLVRRGGRYEVREPLQGDRVPILHRPGDRLPQIYYLSHTGTSPASSFRTTPEAA